MNIKIFLRDSDKAMKLLEKRIEEASWSINYVGVKGNEKQKELAKMGLKLINQAKNWIMQYCGGVMQLVEEHNESKSPTRGIEYGHKFRALGDHYAQTFRTAIKCINGINKGAKQQIDLINK